MLVSGKGEAGYQIDYYLNKIIMETRLPTTGGFMNYDTQIAAAFKWFDPGCTAGLSLLLLSIFTL